MQFQAYSFSNWAFVKVKAPSTSERAPVHLCCIIDVSGSMMHDNKLNNVKHSLHFLLDFLGPKDKITLITFSNSAYTFLSNVFVTPFEKENIRARISIMKPETSTNISAGLIECIEALHVRSNVEKQGIFLLTDGEANLGVTDTKQLITLADSITVYKHASISCIGYGAEHNTELLRGISTKCNGSYYMVHNLDDVAKVFGDILGGLMSCFYQNMRVVFPVGTNVKTRYTFMDSTAHIGDLPAEMEAIILAQLPVGSTVLLKGYDLTTNSSISMECVVEMNVNETDQLNAAAHMLRFEVIELLEEFVSFKKNGEFITKLDSCLSRISYHKQQQDHMLWDILIKELMSCKRALESNIPVNTNVFTQHGECLGLLRGMSSSDDSLGFQFSNGLQRELSDQLHQAVKYAVIPQEQEPLLNQSSQGEVSFPPLLQAQHTQDYQPQSPMQNAQDPFDAMYDLTTLASVPSLSPPFDVRDVCDIRDESLANAIYQMIPDDTPFTPLVRHYNM